MENQNMEAFRTNHRTAPGTPDQHGIVRCVVDGFRVYRVKSGAWRHDVTITAAPSFPGKGTR